MIKYFILSLLVGYILRKFIFFPINQPRPNGYDDGGYNQQTNRNPRPQGPSPSSSKPTKEIRDEEYTDYEEIK